MFNFLKSVIHPAIRLLSSSNGNDERRTDKQLCFALMEVFERDLAYSTVSGIHFYVRDGRVTVTGMVTSESRRLSLIRFVADMDDVISVIDNLTVFRISDFNPVMRPPNHLAVA